MRRTRSLRGSGGARLAVVILVALVACGVACVAGWRYLEPRRAPVLRGIGIHRGGFDRTGVFDGSGVVMPGDVRKTELLRQGSRQWFRTSGFVLHGDLAIFHASELALESGIRFNAPPPKPEPPHVYAVDVETGTVVWKVPTRVHSHAPTPQILDSHVFFGGKDGKLYRVDARTGHIAWTHDFGEEGRRPSTAVVLDDAVIVASSDGHVRAADARDGAPLWETQCGAGTLSLATDGLAVYYCGSQDHGNHLGALTARNGRERWRTDLDVTSAPAVADDVVYVLGSPVRHPQGYIMQSTLYAVDCRDGKVIWEHAGDSGPARFNGPWTSETAGVAVTQDAVFFSTFYGDVYAVDIATRERRWKFSATDCISGAPSIGGGTVFVASYDRHVYALDAGSGELRWSRDCGHHLSTSVVVLDGAIRVIDLGGGFVEIDEAEAAD